MKRPQRAQKNRNTHRFPAIYLEAFATEAVQGRAGEARRQQRFGEAFISR